MDDYNLGALQSRSIRNDDISSLHVSGGYQVVLYENDNFGDASLTVTADNNYLAGNALGVGNWNNKPSPLRVQTADGGGGFSRQIEAEALTDMLGREVAAIPAKTYGAGTQTIRLPGANGKTLPGGVYLVHLTLGEQTFTTKVLVN